MVTVQEPAAEGDAVCLVVEFLRIDLIEVVQLIVFQDLRMEAGYAVDAEAVMDINVSHVYEVVFVDDVNGLIGVVPAYHIIQCIDDRGELGNDFFQIFHRPFLQSLGQDCVVGVSAGAAHDIHCLMEGDALDHEKTDQLRNDHGRVGIVDLDYGIVRKVMKIASAGNTLIKDQTGTVADHEVLLVNTEQTAILVAVIGIEEEGQVFGNVFFIKGDAVADDGLVYGLHIEKVKLVDAVVVADHIDVVEAGGNGGATKGNAVGGVGLVKPALFLNPGVRGLFLEMILKYLLEKAEMIVQAHAVSRKTKSSDRIQEAGCQSS